MPMTHSAMTYGPEDARGLREQRQAVAQEAEGADLVEDADEQHAPADRRLGAGVRQPGVEREQRRLDGEGDEEAAEQRDLDRGRHLQADELLEGEGALALAGRHDVEPMTAASMSSPPTRL
jgi:hypothetical protein